jgi:hypothetical protein
VQSRSPYSKRTLRVIFLTSLQSITDAVKVTYSSCCPRVNLSKYIVEVIGSRPLQTGLIPHLTRSSGLSNRLSRRNIPAAAFICHGVRSCIWLRERSSYELYRTQHLTLRLIAIAVPNPLSPLPTLWHSLLYRVHTRCLRDTYIKYRVVDHASTVSLLGKVWGFENLHFRSISSVRVGPQPYDEKDGVEQTKHGL